MGDEKKPKHAAFGVWSTVKPFVNGGTSGMLATCAIQPIDMIKVRIQLGQGLAVQVTSTMLKNEGAAAFYNGQAPPFLLETDIAMVEEELGAPLSGNFDQFNYEPIAVANLGVHAPSSNMQVPELGRLFFNGLSLLKQVLEMILKVKRIVLQQRACIFFTVVEALDTESLGLWII